MFSLTSFVTKTIFRSLSFHIFLILFPISLTIRSTFKSSFFPLLSIVITIPTLSYHWRLTPIPQPQGSQDRELDMGWESVWESSWVYQEVSSTLMDDLISRWGRWGTSGCTGGHERRPSEKALECERGRAEGDEGTLERYNHLGGDEAVYFIGDGRLWFAYQFY